MLGVAAICISLSSIGKETIASVFGEASRILDSARVYNTSVTLWVFLSQVMSIHQGCVAAVAKLIIYRVANVRAPCSAETGAYCIARDKLDEPSFAWAWSGLVFGVQP